MIKHQLYVFGSRPQIEATQYKGLKKVHEFLFFRTKCQQQGFQYHTKTLSSYLPEFNDGTELNQKQTKYFQYLAYITFDFKKKESKDPELCCQYPVIAKFSVATLKVFKT